MSKQSFSSWFKSGAPWVWLNAGAVSISLVMVVGLLLLIAVRGLSHFWPADVMEVSYTEPNQQQIEVLIGEVIETETVPASQLKRVGVELAEGQESAERVLVKVGNRDYFGLDFRWVNAPWLGEASYPEELLSIERREWGRFYGRLVEVKQQGEVIASGDDAYEELQQRLTRSNDIVAEIKDLEYSEIGKINHGIESLRLDKRRLELDGVAAGSVRYIELDQAKKQFDDDYAELQKQLAVLYSDLSRDQLVVKMADGRDVEMPLSKIVLIHRPNAMGVIEKIGFYGHAVWDFVSSDPREANTEGGVFPAIFGTIMMVLIMAVLVTPFGVIAAVYLKEYAKQGPLIRLIRIAVNNLAGVPSIVYGVFGLGFFVYFLGGNIDELFFQASLPSPTFGTPGLMWASLTLAILTVPVVIVATEEGLSRIPRAIREGSLALGATKAETLWRTVLPMAAPAMMTGLILAVARAAGEVAPLMMVGVVKLAPALAVDNIAPYLHLDRQFMHLGFHIYDVGFQSPNVEAARPLVYATAILLVFIIIGLNLVAIKIRNRLRETYKA
ncbi:MAG: phosphate ABC transporter permease PstA, partial [Gammaproteobacteria bacterium]|nr:phosphate ABC transporter permease PstA [Gammaproteobacteria bacterium]